MWRRRRRRLGENHDRRLAASSRAALSPTLGPRRIQSIPPVHASWSLPQTQGRWPCRLIQLTKLFRPTRTFTLGPQEHRQTDRTDTKSHKYRHIHMFTLTGRPCLGDPPTPSPVTLDPARWRGPAWYRPRQQRTHGCAAEARRYGSQQQGRRTTRPCSCNNREGLPSQQRNKRSHLIKDSLQRRQRRVGLEGVKQSLNARKANAILTQAGTREL